MSAHRVPSQKPPASAKRRRSSTSRRRVNEVTYPELEAEHRKAVTVGGLTATCGLRDFVADAGLMSLRRNISQQTSGPVPVGNVTPMAPKRQASNDYVAPAAKRMPVDVDASENSEVGDNDVRQTVNTSPPSAASDAPKTGDGSRETTRKSSDYSATFGPVIRVPNSTSVGFE